MYKPPPNIVIGEKTLSHWERHVLQIAAATYLTEIVTGQRGIITDEDLWILNLENVIVAMHKPDPDPPRNPDREKLKEIEKFLRDYGTASGDWSLASPVLEIIGGGA